MMHKQGWILVAPMWAVCSTFCACSNDDTNDDGAATAVSLPHFSDLASAPAEIQTAATAVVRLHTARSYGTGAYISSTGLLLTNSHVLGETVCPSEGCYVEVTDLYQRGQKKHDPATYLAIPVASDAGLDVAVVQLINEVTDENPSTPDYLEFDPKEGEALLNQHVTVVGHPQGNLKKWTDGLVTDCTGKWITTTAYVLPGDSGSPILSDSGKIVGIIHRAPSSLDLISEQGVNVYSIGTASASIGDVLNAPLPTTLVSVDAETTEEEFLRNELLFLNSRTAQVNIEGTQVDALDIFGKACDEALNTTEFSSLDDLYETLAPCSNVQTWIDCRDDAELVPYGVTCPNEANRVSWRSRFQSLNARQVAMNGIVDYYSVGPAIAQLEGSREDGTIAGAESLQQLLGAAKPTLNFELAYYLATFAINTYGGVSVSNFVTNYSGTNGYELGAEYIAYSAAWLTGNESITSQQFLTLLKELMNDPKVGIGDKLAIENLLYELEVL